MYKIRVFDEGAERWGWFVGITEGGMILSENKTKAKLFASKMDMVYVISYFQEGIKWEVVLPDNYLELSDKNKN